MSEELPDPEAYARGFTKDELLAYKGEFGQQSLPLRTFCQLGLISLIADIIMLLLQSAGDQCFSLVTRLTAAPAVKP